MKIKTIIQLDDGSLVTVEASVEKTLDIIKLINAAEQLTHTTHSQNISEIAKEEVRAILKQGQKIGAIKRYRELCGVGLKEAKDIVEGLIAVEFWHDKRFQHY